MIAVVGFRRPTFERVERPWTTSWTVITLTVCVPACEQVPENNINTQTLRNLKARQLTNSRTVIPLIVLGPVYEQDSREQCKFPEFQK